MRRQDLFRGSAVAICLVGLIVLAGACGSSDGGGPVGGAVAGPTDTHCTGTAQAIDLSTCHASVDAGQPDYGPTIYNSSGDDDDCKYQVSFTATPIRQNQNVTFTVTAKTLTDLQPAIGANIEAEVFLHRSSSEMS